jgi:protein-S-isoprenylcysteine O-methyltransferase Ste14
MKRKIFLKPPHYFFFCLVVALAFYSIAPSMNWIIFPWNLLGILFIATGIYFISSAAALFRKHKTAISFEKSTSLITEGVFKYTSNPMYFGALTFLFGTSFLLGNIISFVSPVIFFLVINYMFIPYEEEKGEMEFGGEYLEYKKKTKKWI